jgi:ribose/xylose/arabinose/galactoside ABC-type transport system permease subunit
MYGFPDCSTRRNERLGIPFPMIIVGAVAALAYYIFKERPLGRYAFAMGQARKACAAPASMSLG